tara:strand:+ start:292 stop:519 length:228 start_codon:yes stop_codon:yes gene_type:complete
LKEKVTLPYSPGMDRITDSRGTIGTPGNRRERHVVATGVGLFVLFVILAVWAFPSVRDLTLFESVYLWICSPFVG